MSILLSGKQGVEMGATVVLEAVEGLIGDSLNSSLSNLMCVYRDF